MNSVLSYIAGLVILLLIAALVGPTFVDWNQFRNQIEAQGTKLTGRELKIGGDISFTVLPAPHLTINDVSLSNLQGGANPDFLRFGRIDAEVALAPLLSGEVTVSSVTVSHPQVHLEVMGDGRSNWRGLVADSLREEGLFGLASISLEKVTLDDGAFTYFDHRSGRSWRVDHVNGAVMATSLLGPVRANLKLTANDIPLALRLAVGNFAGSKAFPVTAELQTLAQPAKLLFSGVSTGLSSGVRFDGTGRFEFGSTKTEDGQKPKAPLRIEAGVVVGDDQAAFRNLVVAMAGTTLKGNAQAEWSKRPRVNVSLDGEALTLDPLADRIAEFLSSSKVPFGAFATLPVPGAMDARADVKVGGLLIHDVLVRDASLALSLDDGKLSIDRAAGDIGGGTRFEITGALAQGADGGRFDGKVKATSRNMGALANWLGSLGDVPGQARDKKAEQPVPSVFAKEPNRAFSFASKIQLSEGNLAFNGLTAAYALNPDAADLAGDLAFSARDGRLLLRGALAAKAFDLDPLIALWPATAPKLPALLDTNDVDLALKANKLVVGGEPVTGLDMSAAMTKGELDLRHFAAADIAGAKVAAAGVISGLTSGDIATLKGNIHGELAADKTDRLFALAGLDAPGIAGPLQLTLDTTSGEGEDKQTRLDTLMLKGMADGSRVDAVLKLAHAADGKIEHIDLLANAANTDGRALLSQLGLRPGDAVSGAGTASLQMAGTAEQPYDTSLRVNVGQGTFNAKGELSDPFGKAAFAGHVDISASEISPVLAAIGVGRGVSDFTVAQAAGPSFVFSSDVKRDSSALALTNLEAVAGNLHFSGEATWTVPAEQGKKPVLSGRFEANALDLTPLFATSPADKGSLWPTAALDWSVLGAFDGDVELKARALKLANARIDEGDMHLALADGVLSVMPFSAKFADGSATIGARIDSGKGGEASIALNIAVEGADIMQVGTEALGSSFGTGRMDFNAELAGHGRSWLAFVSSISGTGRMKTRNAGLAPLDLPVFSEGLKTLKSLDQFAALEGSALGGGNTPVAGLDGDFAVKDGVAQLNRDALEFKGGKGKLAAMLDLGRRAADAELTVTLDEPQGAPAFTTTVAGKLGSLERRNDTVELQGFVAKRIIADTAKAAGVENIPAEMKNLLGLTDEELKAKGPAAAGIPLPMKRPAQAESAMQ
ncbi:AsmA family protein [Parvibaculum sp.]|uniref:AsmA family protein n=1 Tax=Parvibaculum sp. TaxID=2024848 RepID=UPI00320F20BB